MKSDWIYIYDEVLDEKVRFPVGTTPKEIKAQLKDERVDAKQQQAISMAQDYIAMQSEAPQGRTPGEIAAEVGGVKPTELMSDLVIGAAAMPLKGAGLAARGAATLVEGTVGHIGGGIASEAAKDKGGLTQVIAGAAGNIMGAFGTRGLIEYGAKKFTQKASQKAAAAKAAKAAKAKEHTRASFASRDQKAAEEIARREAAGEVAYRSRDDVIFKTQEDVYEARSRYMANCGVEERSVADVTGAKSTLFELGEEPKIRSQQDVTGASEAAAKDLSPSELLDRILKRTKSREKAGLPTPEPQAARPGLTPKKPHRKIILRKVAPKVAYDETDKALNILAKEGGFITEEFLETAAAAAVGAMSGGILGSSILDEDPEGALSIYTAGLGAITGAAAAVTAKYKGPAAWAKLAAHGNKAEFHLAGGLGDVKGMAETASEEMYKSRARITEVERSWKAAGVQAGGKESALVSRVIESIKETTALTPSQAAALEMQMQAIQHDGKNLMKWDALDPQVYHSLSYLEQELNVIKGYQPRHMTKPWEKKTEFFKKYPGADKQAFKLGGSSFLERGKKRALSKEQQKALKAGTLKEGDTLKTAAGNTWVVRKIAGKTQQWRDFTPAELEKYGMVHDAVGSLRHYYRYNSARLRDAKLFHMIANSDLATTDGGLAAARGWGLVDKGFIGNSAVRKYGALGDGLHHVSPDTEKALRHYQRIVHGSDNVAVQLAGKTHGIWKKLRLGLSVKSYMNASLGNIMLSAMHGHKPLSLIADGIGMMRSKEGQIMLIRAGIDCDQSMYDMAKALPKIEGLEAPEAHGILKALGYMGKAVDGVDLAGDKAISYFGMVDKVFKAGLLKKLIAEGMPEMEAAKEARRVFVSYDLMPAGIQDVRDTIMPFLSFGYRVQPVLSRLCVEHPERMLAIGAALEAVQIASFKQEYGENWREGRRVEKLTSPSWRTAHVGTLFADQLRIFNGTMGLQWAPHNMIFSLGQKDDMSSNIFAMVLLQSPVARFLGGLMIADPSTGQTIEDKYGTTSRAAAVAPYAADLFLPPVPGLNKTTLDWAYGKGLIPDFAEGVAVDWYNLYGKDQVGNPIDGGLVLWNNLMPSIKKMYPKADQKNAMECLYGETSRKTSHLMSRPGKRGASKRVEHNLPKVMQLQKEGQQKMKQLQLRPKEQIMREQQRR